MLTSAAHTRKFYDTIELATSLGFVVEPNATEYLILPNVDRKVVKRHKLPTIVALPDIDTVQAWLRGVQYARDEIKNTSKFSPYTDLA